jgi:hypothetical protein
MKIFKAINCPSLLLAFGLLLASCDKSNESTADTANGERASESESVIQDAINVANDGADGTVDGVSNGRVQACGTVTNDAATKTVTIDFGTGCVGLEGVTRKGKIAIQYVGTDLQTSAMRTLIFTNYTVNSTSITGSISQTGFQRTVSTSYSFSISSNGLQVILSDGRTYTLNNLQRNYSINLGATVQDISDDVTTITGTYSQTNSAGSTTAIDITSPITYNGSCASTGILYPSSGTYKITEGSLVYTIDWGTGVCDKSVSVTVFGKTSIKTLP